MKANVQPPLFIQNDLTVMLEVEHPDFAQASARLSRFADLVKSPQHIHTYRITPLALWNAAAAGVTAVEIIRFLSEFSKFPLLQVVRTEIVRQIQRYGLLHLEMRDNKLILISRDHSFQQLFLLYTSLQKYVVRQHSETSWEIFPSSRGLLKQELIKLGYPVEDRAGYHTGESLAIALKQHVKHGNPFQLREYQQDAVEAFYREGSTSGGSGVLVLPCGAGKTIIGIAAMSRFHCATLILTANVISVRQWIAEIMEKTSLTEEMVGEYSGTCKEVRPITIATYQILTHRKSKNDPFNHMQLFHQRDWGLIIYDEVHLLPAPVFRMTAEIQATRRLGLTATLVREDGCEGDVFSLVGPKRYDIPWKKLEASGWIATVHCIEILIPFSVEVRQSYLAAGAKQKFRIAGENADKQEVIAALLRKHRNEPTLIIGQYLAQLRSVALQIGAPLICGDTPYGVREQLYRQFREGEIQVLVVSKVANFAVDLPDATIAIQISGSFGSRQEEAQRLGRILRPKSHGGEAYFYSLVTAESREQDFAVNRQLFLVEQGYRYEIQNAAILRQKEKSV